MEQKINELQELIADVNLEDISLFFVTRTNKKELSRAERRKALEKFDYSIYRVGTDEDVRELLKKQLQDELARKIKKEYELTPYDLYEDEDSNKIFEYNQTLGNVDFINAVNNAFETPSQIHLLRNLDEHIKNNELWAYCVEFKGKTENGEDQSVYTFRKLSPSKAKMEESKGASFSFFSKGSRVKMIKGEIITIDDKIDCILSNGIYYILHKKPFEMLYSTIRGKGNGEWMRGKWMRMRGICGMLRWFALECKEQKMWIYAEVPLPNH